MDPVQQTLWACCIPEVFKYRTLFNLPNPNLITKQTVNTVDKAYSVPLKKSIEKNWITPNESECATSQRRKKFHNFFAKKPIIENSHF